MTRRAAAVAYCALAVFTCYWLVRLAYADETLRLESVASAQHSLRLASGNPQAYAVISERAIANGNTAQGLAAIRRAVELDPSNPFLWEEYADVAEKARNPGLAEQCLLRAVDAGHTFAPRSALADFYARRNDPVRFWPAMRAALATSFGDVSDLFEMCWSVSAQSAGPETIPALALPRRPDVARQYIDFLESKNRLDLARPVALKLLRDDPANSVDTLESDCDRELAAGNGEPARILWDGLISSNVPGRHLLPYPPLVPEQGRDVTNGDFRHAFLDTGFDWHMAASSGIYATHDETAGEARFEFTGNEDERAELMSEYVSLLPERRHELQVTYQTKDMPQSTGIHWELTQAKTLLDAELPASDQQPRTARFAFTVPEGIHAARLICRYERSPGTVRAKGLLRIKSVAIRLGSAS